MRADLQVHTTIGSPDSQIDPGELPRLCRERGLDSVALTEHRPCSFEDVGAMMRSEGLLLIPAREVSCRAAHVLVLSEDEAVLRALKQLVTPTDLVFPGDAVAVIWAHPAAPSGSSAYAPNIRRDPELEQALSGVEVLNGRHLHFSEAVAGAEELVRETNLAATAGSDAHREDEVGRCFTELDCRAEDGVAGAIHAIRLGKTRPFLSADWAKERDHHYRSSLEGYLG